MNSIIKKIIKYIIRYIIPIIVKKEKKKIIFVSTSNSGCNATALYRLSDIYEDKYELELFHTKKYNDKYIISYIKKLIVLSRANLIITTHGTIGLKGRKEINTWHSVHLKATGAMENLSENFKIQSSWQNVDVILSYSSFYTTTMNACFMTNPYKFNITGMPRNDLLFFSDGKTNLEKIFNKDFTNKKIICYMPTFRMGYSKPQGDKNLLNLFGFDKFDEKQFSKYLKDNNIILLYKLHPNEEPMLDKFLNNLNEKYCLHLSDVILSKNNLDLYDVVNGFDLLMTDYSGIYFDFLLLNKPIIFLPVDLEEYIKTRGFLFEPYDEWTPGVKVICQDKLEIEVLNNLNDNSFFEKDRIRLNNIIHKYHDSDSAKRIWKLIDSKMEEA